jgi:hypothetical protein
MSTTTNVVPTNTVTPVARLLDRLYLQEAANAIAHAAADPVLRLSRAGLDARPGSHARGPELSVHAVAAVLKFIDVSDRVIRQRSITRASLCSYVLKHFIQRVAANDEYVANGDVIAACAFRGIPILRLRSGPNAAIGLRRLRVRTKARADAPPNNEQISMR